MAGAKRFEGVSICWLMLAAALMLQSAQAQAMPPARVVTDFLEARSLVERRPAEAYRLAATLPVIEGADEVRWQLRHDAARAADDVVRAGDDFLRSADDVARASSGAPSAIAGASAVLVPVGIALDVGMRVVDGVETERKFEAGEISRRERDVAHGRNAAGMVGGMAGAYGGAEAGAAGGATIGTFFCPGIGTAIGGFVGGLAGGIGGYFAGDAVAAAGAEAAIDAAY